MYFPLDLKILITMLWHWYRYNNNVTYLYWLTWLVMQRGNIIRDFPKLNMESMNVEDNYLCSVL